MANEHKTQASNPLQTEEVVHQINVSFSYIKMTSWIYVITQSK